MVKGLSIFSLLLFVSLGPTGSLAAQDAEPYFQKNCAGCHTIGKGPLLGPDLRGLAERQSRDWLIQWLLNPEGLLASGDPYALKIQKQSRGMVMPTPPGITPGLAEALLDYIDEQSGLAPEAPAAAAEELPFLPEDVETGRFLFTGTRLLSQGGPACIACHNVSSLGSLGGGRLGPDLTRAYARLGGRGALVAWLSSPPSPTMSPIFQKHPLQEEEIHALVALLEHETQTDAPDASAAALTNFLLLGIGGAVVLLALFDRLWNKRLRGVRKPLIKRSFQQE